MSTQSGISRLVLDLWKRVRLSQGKFADKLGLTYLTPNCWENGCAKPSPLTAHQSPRPPVRKNKYLKNKSHKLFALRERHPMACEELIRGFLEVSETESVMSTTALWKRLVNECELTFGSPAGSLVTDFDPDNAGDCLFFPCPIKNSERLRVFITELKEDNDGTTA